MMSTPVLSPAPTFFIGIDVGKRSHVAGFVSADLLSQRRFEQCPVVSFAQSRPGLGIFLEHVQKYAQPSECAVLVESTGHYHRALIEVLGEYGFRVYVIAVRSKRVNGLNKTDRYDALRLANQLYAQLSLGLQVVEKSQQIRELLAPTPAAAQLQGLVRRHYELAQQQTRVRNKLTAICDELFPEFADLFRDPNADIALDIRYRFPTPAIIASKTMADLEIVRRVRQPSSQKLVRLRDLAEQSIGITTSTRVAALELEQNQLIESLRLIRAQLDALDHKIEAIVQGDRSGQILLSMSIGSIQAGTILAAIGNIRNFPNMAALRKFCGWAPQAHQTGTSADRSTITPTGSRLLRQTLFLVAMHAIQKDTIWSTLYGRLVPLKCRFDSRTNTYKGKMRVLGRVAGQMVGVMYVLLKQDADLVDHCADPQSLPEPVLYDPEIHAGTRAKEKAEPEAALSTLANHALTSDPVSAMMA